MLRKLFSPRPPEGHFKGLYLHSAADFLAKLLPTGIDALTWAELYELSPGEHRYQAGAEYVKENRGMLLWMKRDQHVFDVSFVHVNLRMKALKIKDVEKRLDRNKVNWNWRWEADGFRCLLTYWNFVNIREGEGLELFFRPALGWGEVV